MTKILRYFLCLICLAHTAAKAQPTLTAAGNSPVIGDSYRQQYLKSSSITVPTAGGANQTWNYSNLKDSVGATETFTYTSPAGLPGASNFPNATLATFAASSYSYQYYLSNSSVFAFLGSSGKTSLNITKFTPQYTNLVYPFTFNSTYTDSSTLTNDSLPPTIDIKYVNTFKADAYGTLILPKATYTNVLRVKLTLHLIQYFNGTLSYDGYFDYYTFYANGVHSPLLNIYKNGTSWTGLYFSNTNLPLSTHDFRASWQNQTPTLQWIAENTTNTTGFNILKSTDGSRFDKVGFVATHTEANTKYSFIDKDPSTDKAYYRLEQVDKNGELFYSNTLVLEPLYTVATYKAFPNPAVNQILLSVPNNSSNAVSIFHVSGKQMYQNPNYQANHLIDVSSWINGLYFVRIKTSKGEQVCNFQKL